MLEFVYLLSIKHSLPQLYYIFQLHQRPRNTDEEFSPLHLRLGLAFECSFSCLQLKLLVCQGTSQGLCLSSTAEKSIRFY